MKQSSWRRSPSVGLALSIAAFVACNDDPPSAMQIDVSSAAGFPAGPAASMAQRVCLPGLVESCDCGGGAMGTATCQPDGLAMTPCQCVMLPMAQAGQSGQVQAGVSGATVPVAGAAPQAGTAAAAGVGGADEPPAVDAIARDVRISEIAMFQAVKISLAREGEAVIERNAPVIVGKQGMLRVYVETLPGFAAREIEAHLTLSSAESAVESQVQTVRIAGPSSEERLDSTINFDLPPGAVTADLLYAVELREVDPNSATGTVDPAARYPLEADTLGEMGARNAGGLRVMIVPYRYNGDGSGRMPVVDEAQLQLFRDYIYAYYPIVEVEFELHEPVDYDRAVGPNSGWETWLDSHCSLRTEESPDPKLLYYGVMAPRESIRAYGSGVVGISYLPGPAANYGRCSVGVGFAGALAASTMAHELGHSLGLPHAPCGVSGGPFPYAEALIGSWGYGLSSGELKDPQEYYDLMSYCNPVFISDYNYQKLFERIRYLNLQFDVLDLPVARQRYLRVLQTPDGRRRVTGTLSMQRTPGGDEEERSVDLFDARGAHMGQTTGYFFASSEDGGGVWLVPDRGAASVELDGGARVKL